jgi:hypothetical protein
MNAVEIEAALSDLSVEPFDAQEFPYQFLAAFGNKEVALKRLRTGNNNASTVADQCTLVTGGLEELNYTMSDQDGGHHITAIGRCPDPSSPSGYGEPFVIGFLDAGPSWTIVPGSALLYITANAVTELTPQVTCSDGTITPGYSSTQAVSVGPYLGRRIVQYRIVYRGAPVKAIVCGENAPYVFSIDVQYQYAAPAEGFDGQGLFSGMVEPFPFNSNFAYTVIYTLEDLDIDLVS